MVINFQFDHAGDLQIQFSEPVTLINVPAGVMPFGTTDDGAVIQSVYDNVTSLTMFKGLIK